MPLRPLGLPSSLSPSCACSRQLHGGWQLFGIVESVLAFSLIMCPVTSPHNLVLSGCPSLSCLKLCVCFPVSGKCSFVCLIYPPVPGLNKVHTLSLLHPTISTPTCPYLYTPHRPLSISHFHSRSDGPLTLPLTLSWPTRLLPTVERTLLGT